MADSGDGLPVVLLATIPVLALRLGLTFVRFQSRRRSGVRRFRQTLEAGGMPKDDAARLAQAYHEAGSIRKMIGGALP